MRLQCRWTSLRDRYDQNRLYFTIHISMPGQSLVPEQEDEVEENQERKSGFCLIFRVDLVKTIFYVVIPDVPNAQRQK